MKKFFQSSAVEDSDAELKKIAGKRIEIQGQNIPEALASAFFNPSGSRKPFSYFEGGFPPNLAEKPSPSTVRRSNEGHLKAPSRKFLPIFAGPDQENSGNSRSPSPSRFFTPREQSPIPQQNQHIKSQENFQSEIYKNQFYPADPQPETEENQFESEMTTQAIPLPPPDGRIQYNDPINLYSAQSLNEAFQQQATGQIGGDQG